MKIYDTRYFEKLKIRPVNPNDLSKIWLKHMDPDKMTYDQLKPGYILKTKRNWREEPFGNHWMIVPTSLMKKIKYGLSESTNDMFVLLRPDPEDKSKLSCNPISSYEKTWPNHYEYHCFDVTDVWISDINLDNIKRKKDFLDMFEEYKINEL